MEPPFISDGFFEKEKRLISKIYGLEYKNPHNILYWCDVIGDKAMYDYGNECYLNGSKSLQGNFFG